jgi:hypothetical protein
MAASKLITASDRDAMLRLQGAAQEQIQAGSLLREMITYLKGGKK